MEHMSEGELKRLVADNLIYFRKQTGLTQLQVAEKLNYSDKSVSKWERGEALPDLYVLMTMAELYGVAFSDLATKRDEKKLQSLTAEQMTASKWRHGLITAMSVGLVYLVAVLVYVLLRVIVPDFSYAGMAFCYALPVSAVVLIVFSCLWWGVPMRFLSVGALAWTLAVSFYLTWQTAANAASIFLISMVFTVLEILWFLYRHFRHRIKRC